MPVKLKRLSTISKLLDQSHVLLISKNSVIIRTARTSALSMEYAYVECACAIQGGHPMIAHLLVRFILKMELVSQLAHQDNLQIWTMYG